ncbi:hypothetical protein B0H21DRAFT_735831 [Amylocystis lapponica]|nr:hypothetical protein B0H21DRAFT_735831 [Amylocystis lapponica]
MSKATGDVGQAVVLHKHTTTSPEDAQSGYRSFFDPSRSKTPVPQWLPISLLALTTAALAVPIFLLKRHRAFTLGSALADAPPPPRRTGAASGPAAVRAGPARPASHPRTSDAQRATHPSSEAGVSLSMEDNFNGALYSAKAFGLATMFVTVGAGTTIWGVKTAMGVQNTKEFADRMRFFFLTRMPTLSSRIHRLIGAEDNPSALVESQSAPHPQSVGDTRAIHWSWQDAEQRLKAAYERDGFTGWTEAALQELEAEGHAERVRRGHT